MTELTNSEIGIKIVIKDPLTIRDVLYYRQALGDTNEQPNLERLWKAAKYLIAEYSGSLHLGLDLDKVPATPEGIAEVIWIAGAVYHYYDTVVMSEIPKN